MIDKIKISNRFIGDGEPTFIIAEAGSNHNGELTQAKMLIDAARDAGCDAVKFQVFSAETLVTRQNPAFSVLKENELPREWIPTLANYAEMKGIIFSASPFDRVAVDQLCDVGVPFLKWASPEIHDLPLLKYAASKGKPLLISTGMCNLVDIHRALEVVTSEDNSDIVLLHCVSSYPTRSDDIHLRMMDSIRRTFQIPTGLSDHTTSLIPPVVAVSRGACVVEKHFTLDRKSVGPDHSFAVEPSELAGMVAYIREAESCLGSSTKSAVSGVEDLGVKYKYLVAALDIPKGIPITTDMLTVKRGTQGIIPANIDLVIGRKATRDINADEIINWSDV